MDINHPDQQPTLPATEVPIKTGIPIYEVGRIAGDIVHKVGSWQEIAQAYNLTMSQLKHELLHNVHLKRTMQELRDEVEAGSGDTGLTYRIKNGVEGGLPHIASDLVSEDADPAVRGRTAKSLLDFLSVTEKNKLAAAKENVLPGGATVNVQFNVTDGIRGVSAPNVVVDQQPTTIAQERGEIPAT